jgi:hypothetical protein
VTVTDPHGFILSGCGRSTKEALKSKIPTKQ